MLSFVKSANWRTWQWAQRTFDMAGAKEGARGGRENRHGTAQLLHAATDSSRMALFAEIMPSANT